MDKNENLVEEEKIYDSVYSILFGAFYDVSHKKLDKITRNITKVFLPYTVTSSGKSLYHRFLEDGHLMVGSGVDIEKGDVNDLRSRN